MNKKDYPTEVLDVTIDHLDYKGRGVARYIHPPERGSNGKHLVIFVNHVVPGDKVRVTVPNAKGRHKAVLQVYDELLEAGPSRDKDYVFDPERSLGVPLIAMRYEEQLAYKENKVRQYLEEAGFDANLVQPIIGMDEPYRYRNKMEFTFGPNGELGMHQAGNYKGIVDINDSYLAPEVMLEVKQAVSQWQAAHRIPGFHKDTKEGVLRTLVIRQSGTTDELMVVVYANGKQHDFEEASQDLVVRLTQQFSHLASLLWVEHTGISESTYDMPAHILYGQDYINDSLQGFKYRIYRDTFFQVNPVQATKMVDTAMELAQVTPDMRVLDLFCGVGTFSLPLAKAAEELAGIEIVESSIESAKRNARDNGLDNTFFMAIDARKGMKELPELWGQPDLLVLDPPRSGAGGKVMRSIGRLGTEKVIYVSCNPKSLVEDMVWLRDFGYELKTVVPIDQFPHTNHVENVALLEKLSD